MSELYAQCETILKNIITPRFVYKIVDLQKEEKVPSFLKRGADIVKYLENCEKAILLAATLGTAIDMQIRQASVARLSEAVILDKMAGITIDMLCDFAILKATARLPGRRILPRYSPGYGDFPLEVQSDFLHITDAGRRIGLFVTDSDILTPQKSITAVAGVMEVGSWLLTVDS